MANAWITFLKKYYEDRKKKQPGYSYRNAMKDAKKEYNGHSKSSKRGGTPALVQSADPKIAGGAVADSATAVPNIAAVPAVSGGGRKSRRRKGKKSARKSKKSRKSRSSRK